MVTKELTLKETIIEISRYIRKIYKEKEGLNIIPFVLKIKCRSNATFITLDDIKYKLNLTIHPKDVIDNIINELGCNCNYKTNCNTYTIFVYKKSVKEFDRLNHVLKKLAIPFKLSWDCIYTKFIGLGEEATDYLCYNPYNCLSAIKFIQEHKTDQLNIIFKETLSQRYAIIEFTDDKGKTNSVELYA